MTFPVPTAGTGQPVDQLDLPSPTQPRPSLDAARNLAGSAQSDGISHGGKAGTVYRPGLPAGQPTPEQCSRLTQLTPIYNVSPTPHAGAAPSSNSAGPATYRQRYPYVNSNSSTVSRVALANLNNCTPRNDPPKAYKSFEELLSNTPSPPKHDVHHLVEQNQNLKVRNRGDSKI